MDKKKALLQVEDLRTYFHTEDGIVKAVDGVTFEVFPGRRLESSANLAAERVSPLFR